MLVNSQAPVGPYQQARFIPAPGPPHLLCPLAGTCSPGVYMAHWLTSTRFALMSLQRASPQTLWNKAPPPLTHSHFYLPAPSFLFPPQIHLLLPDIVYRLAPGVELLQGQEFCA